MGVCTRRSAYFGSGHKTIMRNIECWGAGAEKQGESDARCGKEKDLYGLYTKCPGMQAVILNINTCCFLYNVIKC